MLRQLRLAVVALAASVSVALAASAPSTPSAQPASSCEFQTTERVVAVGDVHGAFDQFVKILQEAKLIDARRRWIGGRAVLVQAGDFHDRGSETGKAG